MNQDILNNMNVGEKAVDIQEYYYGENGKQLVYKVTIYECVKTKFMLFFKHKTINTYVYPFFFKRKELAEEFIKYHDKFKVGIKYPKQVNGQRCILIPLTIENPRHIYYMVLSASIYSTPIDMCDSMRPGEIWDGLVNYGPHFYHMENKFRIPFTEIEKIEKIASKEGTTGQTFSYKLTEV